MLEFQLTIYMCSHCTRIHNAAHDCLRHELEEHRAMTTAAPETIPAKLPYHQEPCPSTASTVHPAPFTVDSSQPTPTTVLFTSATTSTTSTAANVFTITDDVKPHVNDEDESDLHQVAVDEEQKDPAFFNTDELFNSPTTSTAFEHNRIAQSPSNSGTTQRARKPNTKRTSTGPKRYNHPQCKVCGKVRLGYCIVVRYPIQLQ